MMAWKSCLYSFSRYASDDGSIYVSTQVPEVMLDDLCARLAAILFRNGSVDWPTNFSIVLSSRTDQSRLTKQQKYKQRE